MLRLHQIARSDIRTQLDVKSDRGQKIEQKRNGSSNKTKIISYLKGPTDDGDVGFDAAAFDGIDVVMG
jgi:hypothetical protein